MYNNLFNYATSELSNDAFICWLSTWADEKYKESNSVLHNLAQEYIKLIIDDSSITIKTVKIKRQYKNIDLVLLLNESQKDEYIICIEDKISTSVHSNQLYRYKNIMKKNDCVNIEGKIIKPQKVYFCYYKIGDQCNYLSPLTHNYKIINRELLLGLFNKYLPDVKNDILQDYFIYLKNYNLNKENTWIAIYKKLTRDLTKEFPEDEIKKAKQIIKGYMELTYPKNMENLNEKLKYLNTLTTSEVLDLADKYQFINSHFGYVNNYSGGFNGFWYGYTSYKYEGNEYPTYIQIEKYRYKQEDKFRIALEVSSVKDEKLRKQIRMKLYNNSIKLYPKHFIKPTKFSTGEYMSFAVLKGYDDIKFNDFKDPELYKRLVLLLKETLVKLRVISSY